MPIGFNNELFTYFGTAHFYMITDVHYSLNIYGTPSASISLGGFPSEADYLAGAQPMDNRTITMAAEDVEPWLLLSADALGNAVITSDTIWANAVSVTV